MKVLLVRYSGNNEMSLFEIKECLGLGYLAAILRKNGFYTRIIDGTLKNLSVEELLAEIVREQADIIGFTIDDPTNIDHTFELIRKLRAEGMKAHLTMGGHTPTFAFKEIFEECPFLDSIVRFEGEETFLELVKSIDSKKDWREIAGIAFRKNGNVHTTPIRPLIENLDSLPFPERDILSTLNKPRRATISSSRGCFGNCIFCSVSSFYRIPRGKKWRARSAENVIEEIKMLIDKFGISEIEFVDDNFIGTAKEGRERAIKIAEKIKALNKKIMIALYCRPDEVEKEIFQLLKEAGLREVLVGIESGSENNLKILRKNVSLRQNFIALNILKDLNLNITIGFIMFNPYTLWEDLLQNITFLRNTGLNYLRVSLNVLQPYPGTLINRELQQGGKLMGTYKEFTYNFVDKRVDLVYLILSRTMDKILGLWLKIREIERELTRDEFFGGFLTPREKNVIKRTLNLIISHFTDIYEEIIKFSYRERKEDEIDHFIKKIKDEVEKFYNKSIININMLQKFFEGYKNGGGVKC